MGQTISNMDRQDIQDCLPSLLILSILSIHVDHPPTNAVFFLASEKAGMIHGTTLFVDGGSGAKLY
jgi:hypothetical protein